MFITWYLTVPLGAFPASFPLNSPSRHSLPKDAWIHFHSLSSTVLQHLTPSQSEATERRSKKTWQRTWMSPHRSPMWKRWHCPRQVWARPSSRYRDSYPSRQLVIEVIVITTDSPLTSFPCLSHGPCCLQTFFITHLIAQLVKNLPAMQDTLVWFLGREDPLVKG